MKLEPPVWNLGDKQKVYTHPSVDWVMTDYDGDTILVKKKDIPEFVLALIGAYFQEADSDSVKSIINGVRKKLDIYKFNKSKNA